MHNKLGDFILEYRKDHSLNMREFASLCNMSHTYISKLEKGIDPRNGKKVIPTIETLQKIANGTNISLDKLLEISGYDITSSSDHSRSDSSKALDEQLDDVLKRLESDGSALMYKGEPLNDATKEALLISLKNTLELADKMHKIDKKNNN